jgi:hypothetical protein
MRKGGIGGAKTQKAGEDFESHTLTNLINSLELGGYKVEAVRKGSGAAPRGITLVNIDGSKIEMYFKAAVHKDFFQPRGVLTEKYFSARLEPDTAIFSEKTNTLTIIEKKQQSGAGSVAEKLQTCDYKMMYYSTLCEPIGVKVDLIWQLGSYFVGQRDNLRSVFEYMLSKGSRYYFLDIPVKDLKI